MAEWQILVHKLEVKYKYKYKYKYKKKYKYKWPVHDTPGQVAEWQILVHKLEVALLMLHLSSQPCLLRPDRKLWKKILVVGTPPFKKQAKAGFFPQNRERAEGQMGNPIPTSVITQKNALNHPTITLKFTKPPKIYTFSQNKHFFNDVFPD